jgi:hypothetical protein
VKVRRMLPQSTQRCGAVRLLGGTLGVCRVHAGPGAGRSPAPASCPRSNGRART